MVAKPPPVGTAPPPDPAAVAEAHRQLLADPSIQFELPHPDPAEMPAWLKWLIERIGERAPSPDQEPGWLARLFNAFEGVAPGLGTLFYVLLGLLVLLAIFFIVRFVLRRVLQREAAVAGDPFNWRPEADVARGLLGDADALAAKGQYSDAAHLLLFRSIEDIDSRRPELIQPAFTSRDIAALEPIPPRPRSAFARIAMAVERSLFAARPLAEGDWRDCRAAYEEFAFADGWQG